MENNNHGKRKKVFGKRILVKMAEKVGYSVKYVSSDDSYNGRYYIFVQCGAIDYNFYSWFHFSNFVLLEYFKFVFGGGLYDK